MAGRALCDDGMVIDLSGHARRHRRSGERARVRVQGGATLGDLDRETHLYGLAVPLGVVSRTGIAGLTLGGGVGWLVRKYGLTCDNVLSFELVTADGDVCHAPAPTSNRDLFWALRGGGGNFGVVTAFDYRRAPGLDGARRAGRPSARTRPASCCATIATSWPRRRRS